MWLRLRNIEKKDVCPFLLLENSRPLSEVKASAWNVGDLGSIPGLGRSPGEGSGNPFQYSCLENPMDRGAWRATDHRVAKSQTQLKRPSTHTHVWESWFAALFQTKAKKSCPHLFPLSSLSHASFFFSLYNSNDFQAWPVQKPSPFRPKFILGPKTLSDRLEHVEI